MSFGTMVAETDSSFNRKRGREATQIYRPPPARCSQTNEFSLRRHDNESLYKDEVIQQQQQYLEALKRYQNKLNHHMVSNTKSSHCPSSPGQYVGVPRENGDKQRYRRPDQQFYVPRGRRHPDDPTPCSTPTPYDEHVRAPSPANSICSVVSEFSGRNRYNRHGKYNRMSYHEEEGKSYSKPPLSFSRESTMSERGGKCKSNLFAAETLQLIERCINHDTNRPLSGSPSWENSPHNKNTQQMKSDVTGFIKGSHSTRDNHPVHSKENLMHPVGQTNRSRKGRRNRKRDTRSRDPSSESLASYSRRGSLSTESLERTFYNSNTTPYERYHFNYDRLNSRNSSRANSRNPSVERIPPSYESHSSTPEWRVQGFSTPTSPVKHSSACLSDRTQRRHSLGKPPTGKIGGTAFNVHLIATSHTPNSSGRDSIEEDDAPPSYPKLKELGKENQVSPQGESQSVNFLKEDKERHTSCSPSTSYSSHEEKKITADEAPSPAENLESLSLQSNEIKAVPKSPESSSTPAPSQPIQEEVLESDSTTKNDENQIDGQRNSHLISNRDESPSIPLESKPHESPPPSPCCHTESKEKNVQSTETITLDDGEDDSSITKVKEKDDHDFTSDDVSSSSVASPEKLSSSVATPEKLPSTAANEKEEMNPKKFSFNWADEVDEDSWDALYDDSGNCLDSSIKNQLEDAIGSIKLQSPANDYLEFKPQEHQIVDEEYGHIIEIYDFPASFQTQDLLSVFQDFKGIDLKWVDDTHALGIFSSPLLAGDCLSMIHPFVKTRPLSKGIEASKSKAIRLADRLPFKPRPETSVALARRLVTGALGLKVQVSKEQRDAERQKLKNAKEKKRLIAKQKEDAWEGTIVNTI